MVLALVCSLGAASGQTGDVPLVSKVYEGNRFLSNIAFIPGTMDMAILEISTGRVIAVPLEGGEPSLLLDISSRLKSKTISEQGLLGIAFQPDFQESGTLYLVYTNRHNQWTLSRFTVDVAARGADLDEEVLLRVDRYVRFHACGQIEFHPIDGYLYDETVAASSHCAGRSPTMRPLITAPSASVSESSNSTSVNTYARSASPRSRSSRSPQRFLCALNYFDESVGVAGV